METQSPREQIISAAGRLFSQKGYHATSIREIAEASGILSGSLYAHIRSKEDLLYDIVGDVAISFLNSIDSVLSVQHTPVEKLREALRSHVRTVASHMDAATVFFNDWRMLSDVRRTRIEKLRDAYEKKWVSILHEGMQQGVFRETDETFLRLLLLSAGNWVYQWYRPDGSCAPDEIADQFFHMIVHGIQSTEDPTIESLLL